MDNFVEYSICPICHSTEKVTLVSQEQLAYEHAFSTSFFSQAFLPNSPEYMYKDHVYFTHLYKADLIRCLHCGHICRNPRLSPGAILQEYTEDSYHIEWLDASYQPYCNSFLELMPRLIKKIGEDAYVLEIGSQVGGFLHAAAAFGWEVEGIDVGKAMVNFSRGKGLKVIHGTLETVGFEDSQFDAVFVWSCFEMLPSPQNTLQEIYRILKPGGHLFISVPNGEFVRWIQPLVRIKIPRYLHETILKILAYDILAAFPFQFGYTASSITHLLTNSNFTNIQIANQLYIPISSTKQLSHRYIQEKKRLLNIVHRIAQFLYYCSSGRLIVAPWIEISCRKLL